MFENISWKFYWILVTVLNTGYYLVVYLIYFRKVFMSQFGIKNFSVETSASATEGHNSFEVESNGKTNNKEYPAQSIVDEINIFFEAKKESKVVKNDLLYGSYGIIKKYSLLNDSLYSDMLSQIIVTHGESIWSVHLHEMK